VGEISVATSGKTEPVDACEAEAKALGRKLADAILKGSFDPRQEAIVADNRSYFRRIVEENKDFRTDEYDRWLRMGWIEK
jgi:hypothetical protein